MRMYCRLALKVGVNCREKPVLPVNEVRCWAWSRVEYPVLFPYSPPRLKLQRGLSCRLKLPLTWYAWVIPKRRPPFVIDLEKPKTAALRCPLQPKFPPKPVDHDLSWRTSIKQPYGSQNMGTKFLVTVYSGPIQPRTLICGLSL